MSKFVATVRVEIEDAQGETSVFEYATRANKMDNPIYFSEYVQAAISKSVGNVVQGVEAVYKRR